jgi:hypothetical protein
MKIASVTVAYNDYHKFQMWKKYYEDYRDEIFLHIIVDNGSDEEYSELVKNYYSNSVIIRREKNGGVTAAYNTGIEYAINNSNVDAVLLIDSDIRMPKGSVTELYNYLYSDDCLGFVAPILMKKDATIIENFGCEISKNLKYVHLYKGTKIEAVNIEAHFVEGVPGGINMAKTELYQKVGLEDEKLFMYADEIDMALRAKKAGYKLGATKKSVAWHQHENFNFASKRHPYVYYLSSRNIVYIASKHFGRMKAIKIFSLRLAENIAWVLSKVIKLEFDRLIEPVYSIIGLIYGIFGNMNENKYSKPDLKRGIKNDRIKKN